MLILTIIAELLILYFLSSHLTSILYNLLLRIVRVRSIAISILTIIYLPGTIIHELAHLMIAEILRVPTGEISFIPLVESADKNTQEVKMGSLKIGNTDQIRRFLVGIAPFLVGLIMTISLLYVWQTFISQTTILIQRAGLTLLIGYFLFAISNSMFSSKKDLEGSLGIFLILAILGFLSYYFGLRIALTGQLLQIANILLLNLSYTLGIVIGINLVILTVNALVLHFLLFLFKAKL